MKALQENTEALKLSTQKQNLKKLNNKKLQKLLTNVQKQLKIDRIL